MSFAGAPSREAWCCVNCVFFNANDRTHKEGTCHRYPPTVTAIHFFPSMPTPDLADLEWDARHLLPIVDGDKDRCGEFQYNREEVMFSAEDKSRAEQDLD